MAWKRLCAIADLTENSLKRFEVDGIALVATKLDGGVVAYPPLCPHMAEPLEVSGICEGKTLTCTKHLWQWDMQTGAEEGMAEKPLLLYPIRQDGEDVLVDIEKELVYDYDD